MFHAALNILRTRSFKNYQFIRFLFEFLCYFYFISPWNLCKHFINRHFSILSNGKIHKTQLLPFLCFFSLFRLQAHHVKTDSAVFRLHTNATVILLVTFSIAVTTRQYVGNPIDCVHTR